MKVLVWIAAGIDIPGGHRAQMRLTAEALRGLGVDVEESVDSDPDLSGFDVVHGFGLDSAQIHRCRAAHIPVALSTIYGSRSYRYAYAGGARGMRALLTRMKRPVRAASKAWKTRPDQVAWHLAEALEDVELIAAYSAADILLPNAHGERAGMVDELGVATPAVVVPNAVDPAIFRPGDDDWQARPIDVLLVGRIEPHKNQLGLIEILENRDLTLTIAGPPHPHHQDYVQRCKDAGRGGVDFIDGLPHERLAHLYRSAKVHVLPSWFETTGLVSLEAALSGCAVVSTSRGHAREYLAELAHYCDPGDPRTIERSISAALAAGPSPALRERILNNYTWRHTAEATLGAYQQILH